LTKRAQGAWKPGNRNRQVSTALRAYAALTTSEARGAIRELRLRHRGFERQQRRSGRYV